MPLKSIGSSLVLLLAICVTSAAAGESATLIESARILDRDALRALLRQGVNVNEAGGDGATALHWVSYHDDLESADLLIDRGAAVNAANDLGATPLWIASSNGSAFMVRRLLEAGADPNLALLLGETPLMVASRSGSPEVVDVLIAGGAEVNSRAGRGQTALMWAAAQKHPAVVERLLAHGADIQARSEVWSQMMAVPPHGLRENNRQIPHGGNTALLFAARSGDLESARLLVAAGADVNDTNAWGVSATVLAAHSGYDELVRFLFRQGADPNAAAAGFSALHEAVMRRDENMVTILLASGADPNVRLRVWTPVRRASKDFNFPPSLVGATPFWMAARVKSPQIMRLLEKHGADPLFVHESDYAVSAMEPRRKEATTALMAAVGMGGTGVRPWVSPDADQLEALTLQAVKVAAELGVDVNASDGYGRTALDGAKMLKYPTVIEFLLNRGARDSVAKELHR